MDPGELKDRIPFLKKKDSDALDFTDDGYKQYKTIWAKVKYMSTKETFKSDASNVLKVVNLIIRARNDITNNMRFLLDGMQYEIKGIRPFDKRKMYLIVTGELNKNERPG
ncbi:phage head closure protein [Vallitalea guaymasensis]|uniref:Phage head closure protein n=1 Tax=Vallitalea guaymasensis TaxID=1185412 RepID=A0A8J8M8L7_9FIRM|nr:phage head closure protein [Vallitalea guaymasensis]QUH28228.1 phage head closure protein [Vallitalea guaymasensis]